MSKYDVKYEIDSIVWFIGDYRILKSKVEHIEITKAGIVYKLSGSNLRWMQSDVYSTKLDLVLNILSEDERSSIYVPKYLAGQTVYHKRGDTGIVSGTVDQVIAKWPVIHYRLKDEGIYMEDHIFGTEEEADNTA